MILRENVSLTSHTTLKTGGVARYMVEVSSVDELRAAVAFAAKEAIPYYIIGTGSNVLVPDQVLPGLLLQISFKGRQYEENPDDTVTFSCGAGEVLDEVIAETVEKGFSGLENLSAIPGTVGATPVQNVGAYGVEVSDCITEVVTYHIPSGEEVIFTKEQCNFAYRNSFFKTIEGKKYIIVSVKFLLQKKFQPKILYADLAQYFLTHEVSLASVREAVTKIRADKFPDWRALGTAGSFFKNPIISRTHADRLLRTYSALPIYDAGDGMAKVSLGYILDKVCNLKGFRVGAVGLYEKQALVLVNYGGASAADVKDFAALIAQKVFAATEIVIEPEVQFFA